MLKYLNDDVMKSCCDFGIKISDIEMDLENQKLISDSDFENEKWFLILNEDKIKDR